MGHLGIFVSARVARLEHRAILESLDEIEALAPGLYEMKIDNPSGDPDCHKPNYSVRFQRRHVEELRAPTDRAAFERVRLLSEASDAMYGAVFSPWVRALSNPWITEALKWTHPMRTSRYLFSEQFNPWMRGLASIAESVSENRKPLPEGHPILLQERRLLSEVSDALGHARKARDAIYARGFAMIFGCSFTPTAFEAERDRPQGGRNSSTFS